MLAWRILRSTTKEWIEDKAPKQAAALAYYTLFALGPLLLVCTFVAGLVFGEGPARAAVLGQFERLLGTSGSKAISDMLTGAGPSTGGIVASAVGLVVLLVGAIGVFAQIKEALNTVWEVQAKPRQGFWATAWGAVRSNLLSFAGLVMTAFLLTVSLVVSAAAAALSGWLGRFLPGGAALPLALDALVALVVLSVVFALLFKFVPDARVAWRDVWAGAVFTAVFFALGQALLGAYLGHSRFATRYGTAGAILVLLLWVYYSSLLVFYGAELTQVYANVRGAHVEPDRDAWTLQEGVERKHAPPDEEGVRGPRERRGGARTSSDRRRPAR